jgi:hypothetical protein
MNKPRTLITIFTIFLLLAIKLEGQSLRAYERKALEAYENQDFPSALAYNQVLIEVDSHRVDALFRGGEAARQLKIFDLAESYLERIPDSLKTGFYTATDFNIASVKKGLGKYHEAADFYKKYIETHDDTSDIFYKRAKTELEFCNLALEKIESPAHVKITHLDKNVNTVYSDFAPLRFADKLYFTSTWQENSKSPAVQRIFAAIQDDPPRLIPENTDKPDAHSSHFSLNAEGRRMYYTICENKALNEYQCQIYFRERKYEGDWTAPKRLPNTINLDGYTATQPAAGRDKSLGKEVLFFASNRPGGKGGMDIWCTVIDKDGNFGDPFPLPFNTPQDDVTPFFHQASQTLFFSSDGLENLGGLDIFSIKKTGRETWSEPENMGYPLNSSYDDLYYTFHSGSKRAYFASNRPGCLCIDPASGCKCNDIYEAEIFVDLTALTYNAIDSTRLNGVQVELLDKADNNIDTFFVNPSGHKFKFPLNLEKNYRLIAKLDGFSTATAEVSTEGVTYFANFERPLYLSPQVELVVRTFNAIDSTALYGTSLQLGAAGENVFHQNDSTSNEHLFPLKFGSDYSVTGAKPLYSSRTGKVSTAGLNQPGRMYLDLYLSPFEGLPLVLYFDNDQPGYVNPLDTVTSLTYEQTYRQFLNRKNAFVTGYSSGLQSDEVEPAQEIIRTFFEEKVEASYARLQSFCQLLENYLAEGHSIEIEVAGYASPLASSAYNERLSGRRISSLINHFIKYNNGALKSYFDSGQLVIKRAPKGEGQAGLNEISDDKQNLRQSVFSPAASRLRRVTITDIKSQDRKK